MIKHIGKWILITVVGLILYICIGCLVPFIHQKQSTDSKPQFIPEGFLAGEELPSPDRAVVVETSMDALTNRLEMIHQAKERIILSTFDIRPGQSADDVFSAIQEAADSGILVQILVDGMYGALHMFGQPIFYALGENPNIEIRFYNIPNPLKPWDIHGRMHDKYVIIDDRLLLLGGRNTFDYFLGEYNEANLSYDRDVLIYNTAAGTDESSASVIAQVDTYFQDMWASKYCRTVFDSSSPAVRSSRSVFCHIGRTFLCDKKIPAARQELAEHYKAMIQASPELATKDIDYTERTVPIDDALLISNPTHTLAKEPWVWDEIYALMMQADERVRIHTPYAVFSKDMYDGIAQVVEHVPDCSMLVNSTVVGDNVMASSDYTHNRGKIVATGIRLREFYGAHSSHGKSILIDDDISIIGSYNLDMRSTYVDTETALVIKGKELNRQLESHLDSLEADSILIADKGTYVTDAPAPPIELSSSRKAMFAVTSRLFQLIRFLI